MGEMSNQLHKWKGDFGEKYTERNDFDWRRRVHPFGEMLSGLSARKILEVGCNRGYNLRAIEEVFRYKEEIVGIEPNTHALRLARNSDTEIELLEGNAYSIPFEENYFDLCFTSGVLIHIPPEKVDTALREIHRVSKRYILSIEYYSDEEEKIEYRGEEEMLWKRDFCSYFKSQFPGLPLIRKGYWGPENGFDRCHWWLLKKT